jgi:tellurite resistance protein
LTEIQGGYVAQKKKGSVAGWIIGFAALVALLGGAPVGIWIVIIGFAAHYVYKLNKAAEPSNSDAKPSSQAYAAPARRERPDLSIQAKSTEQSGYSIPAPPKDFAGPGAWVPYGKSVEVAGFTIAGGMLYVGAKRGPSHGETEPALIDPKKPVSRNRGDFTERLTNYWPSYSEITPEARRAYLRWLAEGKCHPGADLGFVFLYFYGLERRAVRDVASDPAAVADRPHIIAELKRLLEIYGQKSGSFRGYAGNLLQLLELADFPSKLYESAVPDTPPSYDLPYHLRLALGQAAMDGVPIPTHVALGWAEQDPGVTRRLPVTRCKAEFRALFEEKYRDLHGDGIKLTANRTKLKLSYRPASAAFRGAGEVNLRFGDIPDVTALTAPVKKLQAVVDACADELDSYSRFLGRNPERRESLEAVLQLPVQLWPESSRQVLATLKTRVADSLVIMKFQDLAGAFKAAENLTKEKVLALASALETSNVCMEPDVLAGAKPPKSEDDVILFHSEPASIESRRAAAYKAATITVELAAGVAAADGDFSASELRHLTTHVESWVHLPAPLRQRLKARIRLLTVAPVSLASLKKKIEPLALATREAIASFSATMVQADGKVTPDEVKYLEKLYKLLSVDTQKMYSAIHMAATSDSPSIVASAVPTAGVSLDAARITALQKDSEKVSALLANIFTEEEPVITPPGPDLVEELSSEHSSGESRILSLDESHSAFARMLVSRPSWLRNELNDVALDLDVMLDGALERVNEAALDAHDMAFTEGDDPIEVNPEIIEKINQ